VEHCYCTAFRVKLHPILLTGCCYRLLEKGFFHRAMKYEKRSDRKRRLKDIAEKKSVKEERGVTDFIIIFIIQAGYILFCVLCFIKRVLFIL